MQRYILLLFTVLYSKQKLLCTTLLLPLLQFSDIINFVLLLVVNYSLELWKRYH